MMKFKETQPEPEQKVEAGKMSEKLHNALVGVIKFEVEKLELVTSAIYYYCENGLIQYKKFFKCLSEGCEKCKCDYITYLRTNHEEIPEITIPAMVMNFKDPVEPFRLIAKLEDVYEQSLKEIIDIAMEDKDWKTFHFLLKKYDCIDHLCCRALAAVENKANVLDLCEQHTMEK